MRRAFEFVKTQNQNGCLFIFLFKAVKPSQISM